MNGGGGCGMAGGGFTDVMLYSSKSYHQEHATEPRRLPKNVLAVRVSVILRFHSFQSVMCGEVLHSCAHQRLSLVATSDIVCCVVCGEAANE